MLIVTTADDFVKSEVAEWGWDYVEAQFAAGYEPTLVSGVWCWRIRSLTNVSSTSVSTNTSTSSIAPIRAKSITRLLA